MVDVFKEALTAEEALRRPELVPSLAVPGRAGPVVLTRPAHTLSARSVSKRRRVRVRVYNPGADEASFRAYVSGLSFETDDLLKASTDFTVSPGSEATSSIECPDGLITEAGVAVISQAPSDSGTTYPASITIQDDDLPGVIIPIVSGPLTSSSPLTWPRHEPSGDPGRRYVSVFNAGPAPSLTFTLPAGLVGHVISARCDVSSSVGASAVYLRATPPGAQGAHILGAISLPILTVSRTLTFAADLPLIDSTTHMTSPIPAHEGVLVREVELFRDSTDPYAVLADGEIIFSVYPA